MHRHDSTPKTFVSNGYASAPSQPSFSALVAVPLLLAHTSLSLHPHLRTAGTISHTRKVAVPPSLHTHLHPSLHPQPDHIHAVFSHRHCDFLWSADFQQRERRVRDGEFTATLLFLPKNSQLAPPPNDPFSAQSLDYAEKQPITGSKWPIFGIATRSCRKPASDGFAAGVTALRVPFR